MPMNAVEVAIYALVMTASQPRDFTCVTVEPDGVNCTNGLAAEQPRPDTIAYNNGIKVRKDASGRVALSNGIAARFDGTAWVTFKAASGETVVSARRMEGARYKFSNDFICEPMPEPGMARCRRGG